VHTGTLSTVTMPPSVPLPPPPPQIPPPPPPPVATVAPARWRDQRALTLTLTILFSVMVASSALLAVALANRISVVRDFRAGRFGDILQRARDADDFVRGASAVFVLTQVAIAVLFIIWLFRAAKNNEALGREGARFGPGWSIGSWFIPLANLVIPVLLVQDLWRGSNAGVARGGRGWRNASGSALVWWWWAAWILSIVRFTYSGSGLQSSGSLDDIETSNTVALVGVVFLAVAAVLALAVVRALARRQLDALRAQRAEYDAGLGAR
jgi:hypothetical protein